jgi:hypothetical protein
LLSGGWALACFASGGKNFYVKADAGVQASKHAFHFLGSESDSVILLYIHIFLCFVWLLLFPFMTHEGGRCVKRVDGKVEIG